VSFVVADDGFRLNGEQFQVISGSLHYFRVHPDLWEDRIIKARQLGLNTIDTYVAWNFHSSREGEFRTDGWRDLGRFLDLVAQHGLYAIVRPGPYICAEWRNAGMPTWLTAKPGIRVRTSDPAYMEATARYYAQLLPVLADRQITRGGNLLMVQVENEYGAYGDDVAYLRSLVELIKAQGIDVPLFTCDQANDEMLGRGGLPELLRTGTFGSRTPERLEVLRRHQKTGPLMCTEFWDGWFDSWGREHHVTAPEQSAADLDALLSVGGSVNLYMLHGGTNFALSNGANDKGVYVPIVTSYDYDAPLSEDGTPGPKFEAFREVIARYAPVPGDSPAERLAAPEFEVALGRADWEPAVGASGTHDRLPLQDEVDPEASFVVYETDVTDADRVVVFDEVRDRVFAFLDGRPVGTMERTQHQRSLPLPGAGRLRLLVEDLGRVNYAGRLGESKGLIGPARTTTRELTRWAIAVVDHEAMPGLTEGAEELPVDRPVAGPVLLSGDFAAEPGTDLFLETVGLGTGIVWVNGFLLGRYWSAGPTGTMYVPGPLVRAAGNRIVVWELDAVSRPVATFVSAPRLGHTEA